MQASALPLGHFAEKGPPKRSGKAMERTTGLEPATPTLARLYSTPEPLAHLLIFILLSARCTLQMILYRNSPHLSIPIFNFFQKKSKVSTIPSIFALHQTPAQLSSPHKFTPNHPPDESRLLPTPHAHADPPPGGSRRFTPVPTVRPRVASYLRCSGHRKRGQEL